MVGVAAEGGVGLGHDERRARHRLDATGDDHLGLPGADEARGAGDRVQARAAQAVDGCPGTDTGSPASSSRHARDVAVVLAGLVGTAEQHLLDGRRVERGLRFSSARSASARQVVGAHAGERAAVAADGRAHGIADEGVGHAAHDNRDRTGATPVQCSGAPARVPVGRRASGDAAALACCTGVAACLTPSPFITYTFVMSITPGPNNVMLTASGATFGFRRTLPHMLGIVFGFVVQLLAVCAGLSALFNRWPALQTVLSWLGAGLPGLPGLAAAAQHGGAGAAQHSRPVSFHAGGGLFQFLNPKAWVMTVTGRNAVPAARAGRAPGRRRTWRSVMECVGMPCMTVWALFGSSLKQFLASARPRMIFNVNHGRGARGRTAIHDGIAIRSRLPRDVRAQPRIRRCRSSSRSASA